MFYVLNTAIMIAMMAMVMGEGIENPGLLGTGRGAL